MKQTSAHDHGGLVFSFQDIPRTGIISPLDWEIRRTQVIVAVSRERNKNVGEGLIQKPRLIPFLFKVDKVARRFF